MMLILYTRKQIRNLGEETQLCFCGHASTTASTPTTAAEPRPWTAMPIPLSRSSSVSQRFKGRRKLGHRVALRQLVRRISEAHEPVQPIRHFDNYTSMFEGVKPVFTT